MSDSAAAATQSEVAVRRTSWLATAIARTAGGQLWGQCQDVDALEKLMSTARAQRLEGASPGRKRTGSKE